MESIKDIKVKLDISSIEAIDSFINEYKDDNRSGVISLVDRAEKSKAALNKEYERLYAMRQYERENSWASYIAGVDEVGRGPLAGPVVTCALILPKDADILYVNDSKKLSKKKREELYDEIIDKAIAYSIGIRDHKIIDEINILNATLSAMADSINSLSVKPDLVLVDAVHIPDIDIRQESIIKGDAKSISIAAASIVAKVYRDRLMEEYASKYQEYGFESNMGYGSAKHIEAIKKYGPCPIHRRSFIGNFV